MKNFIVIVSLFFTVLAFGQYHKTELTPEEINLLAKTQYSGPMGSIEEGVAQRMVELNNTLFIYELVYRDQPVYTGGLNKWNPSLEKPSTIQMNAIKANLSLPTSQIQTNDLLILLENRNWKQTEIDGVKYISNERIDLFKGSHKEGYTANELIPGVLKFKFYKLVE